MRLFRLFVILIILFSIFGTSFAEGMYDLTPFYDNDIFSVKADDMDDTIEILPMGLHIEVDCSESIPRPSSISGFFRINIDNTGKPVLNLVFNVSKETFSFDTLIIRTEEDRYTLTTEIDSNWLSDHYVTDITDQAANLIQYIIRNAETSIQFRLAGDTEVNGTFTVDDANLLERFYNSCIESGILTQ